MDSAAYAADGNLRLTFASWVVALHAAGVRSDDDAIASAIDALIAGDTDAQAVVDAITAPFAADASVAAVSSRAAELFGKRVGSGLGEGDRDRRLARIRGYQFGRQLPWLARIVERHEDGAVGPSWLLVEQVTDRVLTMDPNPWNDIDEERALPVADFQVLWELDDCTCLAIR